MKKITSTLVLFLGTLTFATTAFADDNDGSLVLSIAGVASDRAGESDYDYGLGALIEANINDHFGIETGALFIKRESELSGFGGAVTQSVSRLHIPVMARFWATDYFSIAAGPFVEFKTGDVRTSASVGGNNIGSISTSADDSTQFGLDAAATFNLAVADKTGLFVEARYSMFFDEEDREDFNNMFYLAGIKLDL